MDFEGIIQSTPDKPFGLNYVSKDIPNVVYLNSDNKDKIIYCNEKGELIYSSNKKPSDANNPLPNIKSDSFWRKFLTFTPLGGKNAYKEPKIKNKILKEY